MASLASYLGMDFYVTGPDAEKPTEADKIKYWREASNLGSGSKALIEGEVVDGDGYSFFTTGKRSQKSTVLDIHKIDQASIKKLNTLFKAMGANEVCKIWSKSKEILGWDEAETFCSMAIITDRTERTANSSNAQGASYEFAKSGAPIEWDGTVG